MYVVTVGHFLSHFYILIYPPLFPYFTQRFAVSHAELGLLMSVGTLGPLLFQIPVGRLVDTVGGKRTLIFGLGLTASGTAAISVAGSFPLVLLFAGVAGLGQAAFHPADYALLEAATTSETRGRTFSVHTFGGYAGFAVAPILVSVLADGIGWRTTLFVSGLTGIVYVCYLAMALTPVYRRSDDPESDTDESRQNDWRTLLSPKLVALFGYFLLTTVTVKGIQTFGPLFFVEGYGITTRMGNAALTIFFVGTTLGILAGGRLVDRTSPVRVIVAALTVAAAGLGLLSQRPGIGALVVAGTMFTVGVGAGTTMPARDSLVSATADDRTTGSSFGFVFTGLSLGAVVSPVVLGGISDSMGLSTVFVGIAVCYLVAAAIIALFSL